MMLDPSFSVALRDRLQVKRQFGLQVGVDGVAVAKLTVANVFALVALLRLLNAVSKFGSLTGETMMT